MGIWAIKHLSAPQSALALTYLVGAVLAGGTGYLGGHVSDYVGRRPLILVGWGFQALVPLLLLSVGDHVYWGLVLLAALPVFGSLGRSRRPGDGRRPRRARSGARPPTRRCGSRRTSASRSGRCSAGCCCSAATGRASGSARSCSAASASGSRYRYIPRGGAFAPEGPPQRGSFGVIVRDTPFLFFMLASVFATMTYIATETLLPISVTTTHHLEPAAWGFLMILNPLLVTTMQLRLTRWTRSVPPSLKLGVAMPMMGVPFLLLNVNGSAPVIALVILIFVFGEMLWVPTSQAVVAALAPSDIRGAYMGVFGGTWSVGWAATPFLGLTVRHAYGDAVMWMCVAAVGVIAGLTGFAAARGHDAEALTAVGSTA